MGKVLFAGSFNPYTIGHHSVYNNACEIFGDDMVHIGIAQNPNKPEQNPHLLKWISNPAFPYFESTNVKVVDEPLLCDFAGNNGYKALVRSIRNSIDLVHELDLATWNKQWKQIQSVFVPSDSGLDHISSSAIRELDGLGKNVSEYLVNQIQYERWKIKKPKRIIVTGRMGSGKSSFIKDYSTKLLGGHSKPIDMDTIVKVKMSEETSRVFKFFFKHTDVDEVAYKWHEESMTEPKRKVETIINDTLDWGSSVGLYEISAFTAYDLKQYYSDSIIVYVSNYTNGKDRDIDHKMMMKCMQLQKIPEVVDFVIDQQKDDVEAVVEAIVKTYRG